MDRIKGIYLFIALVGTITIGTVGYQWIEGWNFIDSFFMTVITITTVGYREVGGELSTAGKLFTSVLIFSGFGVAALSLSHLTSLIIKGELNNIWGIHRMENEIKKMKHHFVIAGYGRTGQVIVDDLKEKKKDFVVIETDEHIIQKLKNEHILHIVGDAAEESVLINAGIQRASGFVSVVSSDAVNGFAIMTAKSLNPNLNIIARALDSKSVRNLKIAGANRVIAPYVLGGMRIAQAATHPHATDFIDIMEDAHAKHLEMTDFTVTKESGLSGIKLSSSQIRQFNLMVIGIKRAQGQFEFQPDGDTVIHENDHLILIGPSQNIEALQRQS